MIDLSETSYNLVVVAHDDWLYVTHTVCNQLINKTLATTIGDLVWQAQQHDSSCPAKGAQIAS